MRQAVPVLDSSYWTLLAGLHYVWQPRIGWAQNFAEIKHALSMAFLQPTSLVVFDNCCVSTYCTCDYFILGKVPCRVPGGLGIACRPSVANLYRIAVRLLSSKNAISITWRPIWKK